MADDRVMASQSHHEASPTSNTHQSPQHLQDDHGEVDDAEPNMEEGLQAHEYGPTHHPSAPSDELFDITTTIDPSYIISLIRKLLPVDISQSDDPQGLAGSQRSDTDHLVDDVFSPIRNDGLYDINANKETSGTQPVGPEQTSRSAGTDDKDIEPPKKSAREEAWEENGCVLWDLAVNKEHAEFMVQNLVLEVLLASLMSSDSVRITEISLGILGNLACHDVPMNHIISTEKLLETIVDQVFSDDAPCLCEVCRLLTLGLKGCQCVVWARAMQSDHILSRVLWITENTLNPVLIERSAGLFLAIMENQQELVPILLSTLVNLGLPNLLVNLMALEVGKLTSDRMPERYPALDSILRAIETLSANDDYSEGICSKKEVVEMAVELIKIPEKIEISSSCVTAAVLIANILADAPYLALKLSEDFLLLQSLLDLFPFTSEDFGARNALWSVLARLLVRFQEAEKSHSRLGQYVSMLVDRSDMIEDALLESEWDRSSECDTSTASATKLVSRTAAIKCIVRILDQWNRVKDEVSVVQNDADTGGNGYAVDRDFQKLFDCCLKHAS
ncbi:uncharacterized protein LOC104903604 [Beta vulgaris subsp. vulgaris]|uniref:uncharacterized protein LOC104903604 n=1 Tax=Beta vulgaris subsp. vulgaris TaxID=3555 RepID=UPI002036C770|nr:uncharacterized protein LOC104903604 [Beta vulgaris subsp. vulgaris]XP_048491773.1 uncharacterized protein LOC104903604 [Beta vulgaris subsp. vulgaris]